MNKQILIGRLGKDPWLNALPSGQSVCNADLATHERWTERETGERKERTDWHRVVFFGKPAELIAQHARKGTRLYVEGPTRKRIYRNAQDEERLAVEVHVREFELLGDTAESAGQPRESNVGAVPPASGGPVDADDVPPF